MNPTAIAIEAGGVMLAGDLALPRESSGLVIFAHGSGSSRHSPRNRSVAEALRQRGFGTLLFDLLTASEEDAEQRGAFFRFDVEALGRRLAGVIEWSSQDERTSDQPVGLFGASTGAAAALIAAAARPERVDAVVSRGGRPDLAMDHLDRVDAPTLLIIGGDDAPVIEYNRRALERLEAPSRMEIVPGATHLFEEPGAMQRVTDLAGEWFEAHLSGQPV